MLYSCIAAAAAVAAVALYSDHFIWYLLTHLLIVSSVLVLYLQQQQQPSVAMVKLSSRSGSVSQSGRIELPHRHRHTYACTSLAPFTMGSTSSMLLLVVVGLTFSTVRWYFAGRKWLSTTCCSCALYLLLALASAASGAVV